MSASTPQRLGLDDIARDPRKATGLSSEFRGPLIVEAAAVLEALRVGMVTQAEGDQPRTSAGRCAGGDIVTRHAIAGPGSLDRWHGDGPGCQIAYVAGLRVRLRAPCPRPLAFSRPTQSRDFVRPRAGALRR
jgi:hypothetical protein